MEERVNGRCQLCNIEFKETDFGDGVWTRTGPSIYEYRGFESCENCFDELVDKVDNKRERIMEDFESRSFDNYMPANLPSGAERPFHKEHNELNKQRIEIASNPNWEEEDEYRKGKL